jgi:hypothetical protein
MLHPIAAHIAPKALKPSCPHRPWPRAPPRATPRRWSAPAGPTIPPPPPPAARSEPPRPALNKGPPHVTMTLPRHHQARSAARDRGCGERCALARTLSAPPVMAAPSLLAVRASCGCTQGISGLRRRHRETRRLPAAAWQGRPSLPLRRCEWPLAVGHALCSCAKAPRGRPCLGLAQLLRQPSRVALGAPQRLGGQPLRGLGLVQASLETGGSRCPRPLRGQAGGRGCQRQGWLSTNRS